MNPKHLVLVLLAIASVNFATAQNQQWFWGFSIIPQHSEIYNANDSKAASVESGTVFLVEGTNNGYTANPATNDNGEVVIPNSISLRLLSGYRFSDYFSLVCDLGYSYQQHKYSKLYLFNNPQEFLRIKNSFQYAKLSVMGIASFPLGNFTFFDVGIGAQPSYLISSSETSKYTNELGVATNTYIDDSGYHIRRSNGNDFDWQLNGDLFNAFNLEGRALLGIRWSGDNSEREYFLRFTADYSFFDIENKSATIEQPDGSYKPYYEEYHTPSKWERRPNWQETSPEICPDCEAERPPSHNFTAGIAIGVRVYLR